jgi:Uma2 family endonuclease
MATATTTQPAVITVEGDKCVALRDIDWKGYSRILQLRGERSSPKLVYLDGSLLLVSPSYIHERVSERLGIFVIEVVVGLDIPCKSAGSTTFRRRKKDAGVEGDKTYYLANVGQIQGKRKIDLRVDPLPDLAVEAVHTHQVAEALEVHRRLRVPEVWVCDGEGLQVLVLQGNGRYARAESSAALPFLKANEILGWITKPETTSDTEWIADLRRWVREVLAPRRAGQQS